MDLIWMQKLTSSQIEWTNETRALERISVLVRKDGDWKDSYQYTLGHSAGRNALETGNPAFMYGIQLILEDFQSAPAMRGWEDALEGRERDNKYLQECVRRLLEAELATECED